MHRSAQRRIAVLITSLAISVPLVAGAPSLVPAAFAAIPSGIAFTQEGCNNPGTLSLPDASGDFICPTANYTTGNLGNFWSELDLVPLRVIVFASSSAAASSTFSFAVAADNTDSGKVGFDVLSAPALNTDSTLSAASCSAATVGSSTTANGDLLRLMTITIASNTRCTYDYYARLALGAHNYPGSSVRAFLADDLTGSTASIGTKAVSINPLEIAPQSISKDMSATQNSDHVWDVTKSPSPASLSFTNTCDPAAPLSQTVAVTVTWTKQAANPSGSITVITHVYASNPAARTVTVSVSDQLYSGTTGLDLTASGDISVPSNTADYLVLTSTTTVPAGTTDINDIATATYTDSVTGIAIPGTTTATASATVQSGSELDASAVINDVESITGTGLSFSVDSVSGATGSFDSGYVAGTHTTGPVSWTSSSQAGSGSATFSTTVYATAATVDDTGGLSDTATVTASDGFTTDADLTVDVSTDATTSLTVTKDASIALASEKTYTFHLFDGADTDLGMSTTVTLPASSMGPVTSDPITGLSPSGTYYVKEDANAPFPAQTSSSVAFSLVAGDASTCSANIDVTNTAADQAPVADAGADQTVVAGTPVTLDGSGSSDPDGDNLTYEWSQTGGATVTLSGATTSAPTFTAPAGPATLTFQLQVCDPAPLCATDSVVVSVLRRYVIQGFYSPVPNSKWKAGQTVPVKVALTDQAGTRISDVEALALLSSPCRVQFSASGAQTVAPVCMKYDAAAHQFIYNFKLGSRRGSETIRVTVTYPPTSVTTTRSETITI